jgi:hypothetical protein
MRFGIFYEHQLPRPWAPGDERRLLSDALEQVELADRLGIDYLWEVEHHFLEEYSHSSAPEVFLGAASQRTGRIRLGHGIVQLPPAYNHPARVAERIATLDLLSGGRVEFGTGESSSETELGGFGIAREDKRAQWDEALDVVTRMLVEEPFAGHQGKFVDVPPRNVIPKPLQKPHPPLWVACSRRETIHLAATKGIGALSFSFIEPRRAKEWVDDYYATIASDACVPAGFAVNPQVACVLPLMCHQDEETAIERGLDGAHFFGYALAHYYVFGTHQPSRTSIWDEFQANRSAFGFDRQIAAQTGCSWAPSCSRRGWGRCAGRSARRSRSASWSAATRPPGSTSWCSSARPAGPATSTSASRWSCSPTRSCRSSPSRPTRTTRPRPSGSPARSRPPWPAANRPASRRTTTPSTRQPSSDRLSWGDRAAS